MAPADARLLLNEDAEDFLAALAELEQRAHGGPARGERTALLVYYSGHAKDGALRLGDTRLPFEALKRRLARAPADIRIAIFDSCRSGALTRTKGARQGAGLRGRGRRRARRTGLVILTSSAADEDSQESDALGGSYFSHHLASGLLGDADRSRRRAGDALRGVRLRVRAHRGGHGGQQRRAPQHPTFSYDLAGNGDLVLTDVRARDEGLVVPARRARGRLLLRGPERASWWPSWQGARTWSGGWRWPPGTYRVKRRLADRLRIGEVEVRRGRAAVLEEARLRDAPFSDDPVKGARARRRRTCWTLGLTGGYQSFFDAPTRESLFLSVPLLGAEVSLHDYFRRDWVLGLRRGAGRAAADAGAAHPRRGRATATRW